MAPTSNKPRAPTTDPEPTDTTVDDTNTATPDPDTPSTPPPTHRQRSQSALFTPLTIANGNLTLSHRIIMAPMTRNRGAPLHLTCPNRAWTPDYLAIRYYTQRSTPGGLLITEGIPPNLIGNGTPGVPGLFLDEQIAGWKAVVDAVHAEEGYIYAQLWHAGRAANPAWTGYDSAVSSSATRFEGEGGTRYPAPDENGEPGEGERVLLRDVPVRGMGREEIRGTIADFVGAARRAVDVCGFDGVEVHGGNGYLVEQFLSTNVNKRDDEYGGDVEGYVRFPMELMLALRDAVGGERLAMRLTPFGLFNQMKGENRIEIWSHLCRKIKDLIPDLSYVHFIEPRFEQVIDSATKETYLKTLGSEITLKPFRDIMGSTPFVASGGYNDNNIWGIVESGTCDAISVGRYFLSTPDLVSRLKKSQALNKYDRERFYWVPYDERDKGYTDYPCANETPVEPTVGILTRWGIRRNQRKQIG